MKIQNIVTTIILSFIIVSAFVLIFFPPKVWNIDHISINGDFDFVRYNFPGKGTPEDPYIIKGYNLTNPEREFTVRTGIEIHRTTKHFVITDCILSYYYRGILVYDVKAGTCTVMNNTILEGGWSDSNPASGIAVYSDLAYIFNNSVNAYYGQGISFSNSNCTVESNYVSSCWHGIQSFDSSNTIISENHIEGNIYGISLVDVINTHVADNFLNNTESNISFSNIGVISVANYIYNNTCINAYIGIRMSIDSNNFFIFHNDISYNIYGIISEGDNCTIYENLFYRNFQGVYLWTKSNYNIIFLNNFIDNPPPSEINQTQASDNGYLNLWYHPYLHRGNYWSDIGTNLTYQINGSAESVDFYPLANPQ